MSETLSTAQKLADTAASLLAGQGPAGVTFRLVAEAAGLSVATVQHHFGTKEGLLHQALRGALAADASRLHTLATTINPHQPLTRAEIHALVRSLVMDACGANAARTRARLAALMAATRDRTAQAAARRWLAAYRHFFESVLRELAPQPREAARFLVDAMLGVEIVSLGCRWNALVPLLNDELLGYLVDAALMQGKAACPPAFRSNVAAMLHARALEPATPLAGKAAEARRQLLSAAAFVLARGGANELTHRAVAKEAGVSASSATYHFGTVGELMHAAYRHIHDGFARVAMPPQQPPMGAFEAVLMAMLHSHHGGAPAVLGSLEVLLASAYDETLAQMAWQTRLMRGVYYLHAPDAWDVTLGSADYFAHALSIWALGFSLAAHAGWRAPRFEGCVRARFAAVERFFPESMR
jgi:TetR/AcrR family transcriptional regulator, regulator of biofilm formation and stress response